MGKTVKSKLVCSIAEAIHFLRYKSEGGKFRGEFVAVKSQLFTEDGTFTHKASIRQIRLVPWDDVIDEGLALGFKLSRPTDLRDLPARAFPLGSPILLRMRYTKVAHFLLPTAVSAKVKASPTLQQIFDAPAVLDHKAAAAMCAAHDSIRNVMQNVDLDRLAEGLAYFK